MIIYVNEKLLDYHEDIIEIAKDLGVYPESIPESFEIELSAYGRSYIQDNDELSLADYYLFTSHLEELEKELCGVQDINWEFIDKRELRND